MKLSVSILLPSRKVPTSYHLFEENGVTVNLPYIKPTDMLDFLFFYRALATVGWPEAWARSPFNVE